MNPQMSLNKSSRKCFLLITLLLLSASSVVIAQTAGFTYQGNLSDGGNPANGNYDLQFKLYDALTAGTQLGERTRTNVSVTSGVFTVQLDFAPGLFSGSDRFLEIGLRAPGSPGFIVLSPRQPITSSPYAFHSLSTDVAAAATTATNANQLGGVDANEYVLTTDLRLTDERAPTAGSGRYIQNGTSLQATSNFNISGNGTAGGTLSGSLINATTFFNINGVRVLSIAGTSNVFVGSSAGLFNSGDNNSFVGRNSGVINMAGSNNSFFGSNTGFKNQTGQDNAFFGTSAGQNSTASNNSFFGSSAGKSNTSGSDNAFFGVVAGELNTLGVRNSFFGGGAGRNTEANDNSFFGNAAGYNNTTGHGNTFLGYAAGFNITTGSNNTFIGTGAGAATPNLTNATAIGSNAQVTTSNTMVLGTNTVTVEVPGSLNISGSLTANLPSGDGSYIQNRNSQQSGNANFNINGNGTIGGTLTTDIIAASIIRASEFINAGTQYNINGSQVLNKSNSSTIVIGRTNDTVSIPNNLDVSNSLDTFFLNVFGPADFNGQTNLLGSVLIQAPVGGGNTELCQTSSRFIALCSSSLRYKTSTQAFIGGLDIVRRLRPISFTWREGGMRDVGFGAEDVFQVEPLLTTRNDKGEIEGVKYRQITTVLVNAIQQQQQIIERQQKQMDALKQLVCLSHPNADVCR